MALFHIRAGQKFLPALAQGIIKRFKYLNLGKVTILLPSIRSAIALKEELSTYDSVDNLPKILTFKDIFYLAKNRCSPLKDLPILSPIEYKINIANKIYKHQNCSYNNAFSVACELHEIIEQLEKENIDLTTITSINLGELPQHIEKLINNFKIVISQLGKAQEISDAAIYNQAVTRLIAEWNINAPNNPIIAAGSTGSIKATSTLLEFLVNLPNGFVVLNAADIILSENSWNKINEYHPSFYIKKFLDHLAISRDSLVSWVDEEHQIDKVRERFLSEVMCPAGHTVNWQQLHPQIFNQLNGISYAECNNLHEESFVITTKVKELLNLGYSNIGVITYNSLLAKRIQIALADTNIEIDNSYGQKISDSPECSLIKLSVKALEEKLSPHSFLGLIKHPLFNCNVSDTLIYKLEIEYFRGMCKHTDLMHLATLVESKDLQIFLQKLYEKYNDFTILLKGKHKFIEFANSLFSLILCFTTENKLIINLLDELKNLGNNIKQVTFFEFKNILNYYLAKKFLYEKICTKPSLYILSPTESRLLSFDYVILAGLNDDSWPQNNTKFSWINDALASKAKSFSFQGQQIGKSARDFYILAHNKEVLLTRSRIVDGSSKIESRFITRLKAVASKVDKITAIEEAASFVKHEAKQIYTPKEFFIYKLPKPKPPKNLRPTSLSVTAIEKLVTDPYYIYATKILNLKKLDDIDRLPTHADFGNFIHKIIDIFNKNYQHLNHKDALKMLMKHARNELVNVSHKTIIDKIWIPRFKKIAKWLVEFEERVRSQKKIKICSEIKGSLTIPLDKNFFFLTAKADRIEICGNTCSIIDFKTGTPPNTKDTKLGFAPQLLLEALIAKHHGFNIKINKVEKLCYIQLGLAKKLGKTTDINDNIDLLTEETYDGLIKLVNTYMNPETPYLIGTNNNRNTYNDFIHLERVQESIL